MLSLCYKYLLPKTPKISRISSPLFSALLGAHRSIPRRKFPPFKTLEIYQIQFKFPAIHLSIVSNLSMAQEIRPLQQTLEVTEEDRIGDRSQDQSATDHSLSRTVSASRLNARAPEFVPRAATPSAAAANRVKIQHQHQHPHHHHQQPVVHVVYHHPPPPPPPESPQFVVPAVGHAMYHSEYYGGGIGEQDADPDQAPLQIDGLSEDVTHKITKQVEYYFSDANLATTELLMRFITKDPEGFVPITVIASFKKIKALVHNNSLLADVLRTSTKLVVSEDGKKVRRQQPFTESDVGELQSRIVVAENLPDNHCYQSLMKVFSAVGSVRTIRTCYPQTPNGTSSATNRSSKMDMLFANKLHAFVEYETVEDVERAVVELNDGRNWRSGLRVRLLSSCMVTSKPATGRGKKPGHEGDDNIEDASVTDPPKAKHTEQDPSQSAETLQEHGGEEVVNDKESGPAKREKGRGRVVGKGRGRGHYHSNNNNSSSHHRGGGHAIGTPPSSHLIHSETGLSKQPPGPRMPDGTRGFTMGRGKPLPPTRFDERD